MRFPGIFKSLFKRFRVRFFPTLKDKETQRFWADGGAERFCYNYDLNSDSLVIDLGGYKGQWASDIYSRYKCRIMIFEPVLSFAAKIEERFRKNPGIEVFSLALGKNQREDFIAIEADASSMFIKSPVRETIQFEDVKEFFAQHNIKSIDLMKINIEGGEYELMSRLIETGLIHIINHILIQFHDFGSDSEILMENICHELSKTHTPTYQYKFIWENWTRFDVKVN